MVLGGSDDVIRIRIDTGAAIREFLGLLLQQAAEGETRAPAFPEATAVFRELAPYRLVEYEYVDDGVGGIEGAYVGFPDGTLFAASDEIPEEPVHALIHAAVGGEPAPIYVYVVLNAPSPAARVDAFLRELSSHVGLPLVGVFRDESGAMAARGYDGETPPADSPARETLAQGVAKASTEADWHLDKARVLERFAARTLRPDGRAYASLSYNFVKHMLEFVSAAERDDFVAWSRLLCDWVYAKACTWQELGFKSVFRPADPSPAPRDDAVLVRVIPPAAFKGGLAWSAFGGTDAASSRDFANSAAATDPAELARSLGVARDYWQYVQDEIERVEAENPRPVFPPVG